MTEITISVMATANTHVSMKSEYWFHWITLLHGLKIFLVGLKDKSSKSKYWSISYKVKRHMPGDGKCYLMVRSLSFARSRISGG